MYTHAAGSIKNLEKTIKFFKNKINLIKSTKKLGNTCTVICRKFLFHEFIILNVGFSSK